MKSTYLVTSVFLSLVATSGAFVFSYGYKTVYDANADLHVIGTSNVRKYNESFGFPPASYWGPTENNVIGLLTKRFDFTAPTSLINLRVDLASFNFAGSGGSGSSSLWASTNGADWVLLLENPTPVTIDSYMTYNQDVPAELLGTTSFYVQSRLMVQDALNTSFTTAQFSRSDANRVTDVFQINANVVPEPSTGLLGAIGIVVLFRRRTRNSRNDS